MIISEKYKYIFISTQKTGTNTFYKLLTDKFEGERQSGAFHRTEIPSSLDISKYTVFSTCRNPYDRMVSLWYSLTQYDSIKPWKETWIPAIGDDTFLSFCKYAAKNALFFPNADPAGRVQDIMIPQYIWYKQFPIQTISLKIENINEEFHRLPFVDKEVEIPWNNRKKHPSFEELKNNEIIKYVNTWAGKDFEKFGYDQIKTT